MKDRILAAMIHIGISLLLALLILFTLYFLWFPSPLMGLGAVQGVQLILFVDLVAGPLLTLLVFKRDKPGIKFDLTAIGIFQLVAMGYGLWVVYGQTPAYMLWAQDGLHVVSRYDVDTKLNDAQQQRIQRLISQSISYEGRVPVLALREPEDGGDLEIQRIDFELNNELSFYLNLDGYEVIEPATDRPPFGDLSGINQGCVELDFRSPHGEAKGCVTLDKGRLTVSN